MAPPQTHMGRLILRELVFNVEISVKATCHKSIAAHSFLTHLIFPSPLYLSTQIVLLINYAIIPIGWLIAASSPAFPLQINSLTTVTATGWAKISDAACATGASVSSSFCQMKLQGRAAALRIYNRQHHCRIATDQLTPQHLTFSRKDHFIEKSRCWLAGRLNISLHFNCNNVSQCERGVGHSVLNMQRKKNNEKFVPEFRVYKSETCIKTKRMVDPLQGNEMKSNPESDSGAWEQRVKGRPVFLIKITMHSNSMLIKF